MISHQKRRLKEQAHHLKPVVRVGKSGLTTAVLASVEQALRASQLIKVRFEHERNERDELAQKVAEATGATLIWQIGKVGVFYRPRAASSQA